MSIKLTHGIGARFKCAVYSADNKLVKSTPEFKNLVLDTGLNRMSVGTWFNRVLVGTGNSKPVVTQTGLDNFLKSTSTQVGSYTATRVLGDKPYYDFQSTFRFPQGAAAGNLAEIAIGWSDGDCWNRTLIKDALGNPTVLTVLDDEYLEVTVIIRVYVQKDITGTLKFKGRNGEVLSTHTVKGMVVMSQNGQVGQNYDKVEWGSPSYGGGGAQLYYGTLNAEDYTKPPNDVLETERVFRGINTYPNARTCRGVRNLALDAGNGPHRCLFSYLRGVGADSTIGYKFEITPAYVKKNTEVMSYTFEVSWNRLEE